MAIDRARAARAIFDFLQALGFDPTQHADLSDTPELSPTTCCAVIA